MGTLRFLLALSVAVAHAGGVSRLGYVFLHASTAVQAFYIISGFLITMVLNNRKEYQSVGNFYVSRYLRLWPTYIIVFLIALMVYGHNRLFVSLPRVADLPTNFFILFSNFTLLFQDWFFFLRFTPEGGLIFIPDFTKSTSSIWSYLIVSPAWTLGIELTFYIIAPFVCRNWKGTLALFLFGLCCRLLVSSYFPHSNQWEYRFAPSEMMFFAAGGLAYFASRFIFIRFPAALTVVGYGFFVFLVAAVLLWAPVFSGITIPGGVWIYQNLYFTSAFFLVAMIFGVGPLFYATQKSVADRWIGELSYPIYICHEIILYSFLGKDVNFRWGNVVIWGMVIPASILLVLFVALPVDRLRKRYGAHSFTKVDKVDQPPLYAQASGAV